MESQQKSAKDAYLACTNPRRFYEVRVVRNSLQAQKFEAYFFISKYSSTKIQFEVSTPLDLHCKYSLDRFLTLKCEREIKVNPKLNLQ